MVLTSLPVREGTRTIATLELDKDYLLHDGTTWKLLYISDVARSFEYPDEFRPEHYVVIQTEQPIRLKPTVMPALAFARLLHEEPS